MKSVTHRSTLGDSFVCFGQAIGIEHESGDLVLILVRSQFVEPIGDGVNESIAGRIDRRLSSANSIQDIEPMLRVLACTPRFEFAGQHRQVATALAICAERIELGVERVGRSFGTNNLAVLSGLGDLRWVGDLQPPEAECRRV